MDRDYGTGMNREEAVQLVKAKYGMENFILCVSRIEPRKNQALLMKIYLDLKLYKKNIPLIFIGGESIPVPSLKKMLDKTGEARSFIHFLQDMPPGDLVSFYSSCRLFIYPSLAEGFGIPPLEAAVCLAPVICSSSTAMRDFEFFGNGLFNPKNERDLSVKISEFLNDPPSITKRTRIAERIKETYSWEKTASLFYHLLMENR